MDSLVPNPHRFAELIEEERFQKAAQAILQYANRDVAPVLFYFWCVILLMAFSPIFTVRLALLIPLWNA